MNELKSTPEVKTKPEQNHFQQVLDSLNRRLGERGGPARTIEDELSAHPLVKVRMENLEKTLDMFISREGINATLELRDEDREPTGAYEFQFDAMAAPGSREDQDEWPPRAGYPAGEVPHDLETLLDELQADSLATITTNF